MNDKAQEMKLRHSSRLRFWISYHWQIGGVRMFPKFCKVSVVLVREVVGLGWVGLGMLRWERSGWWRSPLQVIGMGG